MNLPIAGDGETAVARSRGSDLADIAAFTLDATGRIASWSASAAQIFGRNESAITGRHLSEVLLADAGQRELVAAALAEVAAGRVFAATAAVAMPSGGQVAIRCEPLATASDLALVVARRISPRPDAHALSEAAAQIGTTLDLTQTAREVVEVAVPGLADAASIFIPERLLAADELPSYETGRETVARRMVARLAGQSDAETDLLLRPGEVIVFGEDSPCNRAMTTGRPVLFSQLDGETSRRISRRPGGEDLVTSYTSFLALPLAARGSVLGCATFGRAAGSPAFDPADLAVASQLAARAAACIDNARLYHRERRIALALQRGLLPSQPAIPDGLEVAHRSLPVGASVVGGDWYDIVPLPGGRAALIVGDAMGHGPEAAAVMVQLRTAAHTLADLELPPEEVLRRLDRMVGRLSAPFATCICAVLDPADDSCVIATAGHLPPLLAGAGQETAVLELPTGLPLGLGVESFQATQISLPPGATLALYTDGLVESRARSLDDGLVALRDALDEALAGPGSADAAPPDPVAPGVVSSGPVPSDPLSSGAGRVERETTLDDACGAVTRMLRHHGEDDITLVLARIRQS